MTAPYNAILLVGPTGAGKTPLGDLCQERGLWQRRCVHFDFGANLRRAAVSSPASCALSASDISLIKKVLAKGALLEDDTFHIALQILTGVSAENGLTREGLLVMNGLPRHPGQAQALASLIQVRLLVYLECDSDVVRTRLTTNAGGDRTERIDDGNNLVAAKLRTFRERTLPLLDWYRERDVKILTLRVEKSTSSDELRQKIELTWNSASAAGREFQPPALPDYDSLPPGGRRHHDTARGDRPRPR